MLHDQRSCAKLLWDARRAADRIAKVTAGRSFEDYLSDEVLRWAVERQFIVIGEAMTVLRRIDLTVATGIPDLSRINGSAMCLSMVMPAWTIDWSGVSSSAT